MDLFIDKIASPIGEVRIISDGSKLVALDFEDYEERMQTLLERYYGDVALNTKKDMAGISSKMRAYFAGDLSAIDEIPVANEGSDFQKVVWRHLRKIPAGETWSYGQLAKSIGKPSASRAVGLANGSNPIAIVVPCHRVIGANGTLTGYGGGLERKKWLLEHEGALQRQLAL
ncbi:MAG: methylated-DNA--[protein]-cysteine S-methyltransferase [Pseudomonadota bacterium]